MSTSTTTSSVKSGASTSSSSESSDSWPSRPNGKGRRLSLSSSDDGNITPFTTFLQTWDQLDDEMKVYWRTMAGKAGIDVDEDENLAVFCLDQQGFHDSRSDSRSADLSRRKKKAKQGSPEPLRETLDVGKQIALVCQQAVVREGIGAIVDPSSLVVREPPGKAKRRVFQATSAQNAALEALGLQHEIIFDETFPASSLVELHHALSEIPFDLAGTSNDMLYTEILTLYSSPTKHKTLYWTDQVSRGRLALGCMRLCGARRLVTMDGHGSMTMAFVRAWLLEYCSGGVEHSWLNMDDLKIALYETDEQTHRWHTTLLLPLGVECIFDSIFDAPISGDDFLYLNFCGPEGQSSKILEAAKIAVRCVRPVMISVETRGGIKKGSIRRDGKVWTDSEGYSGTAFQEACKRGELDSDEDFAKLLFYLFRPTTEDGNLVDSFVHKRPKMVSFLTFVLGATEDQVLKPLARSHLCHFCPKIATGAVSCLRCQEPIHRCETHIKKADMRHEDCNKECVALLKQALTKCEKPVADGDTGTSDCAFDSCDAIVYVCGLHRPGGERQLRRRQGGKSVAERKIHAYCDKHQPICDLLVAKETCFHWTNSNQGKRCATKGAVPGVCATVGCELFVLVCGTKHNKGYCDAHLNALMTKVKCRWNGDCKRKGYRNGTDDALCSECGEAIFLCYQHSQGRCASCSP